MFAYHSSRTCTTDSVVKRMADDQKWKQLRKWFEESGGIISDAYKLMEFEITGRGVGAARKVEKDERLVQVPKNLQFTAPWILKNCQAVHSFMAYAG